MSALQLHWKALHEIDPDELPLEAFDQIDRSQAFKIMVKQNTGQLMQAQRSVDDRDDARYAISTENGPTDSNFADCSLKWSEVHVETKPPLGSGAFGVVYKAFLQAEKVGEKEICIKQARSEGLTSLQNELKILMHLWQNEKNDPDVQRIIRCHGLWSTNSSQFFLYLDYFTGASLSNHIKLAVANKSPMYQGQKICRNRLLDIMYQLLTAVNFLRRNGVLHLDIKPDNVLYSVNLDRSKTSYGILKLIDFGLAVFYNHPTLPTSTKHGTVMFMAPEVMKDGCAYTNSDIFSAGITFYQLILLEKPWAEITKAETDHRKQAQLILSELKANGTDYLQHKIASACEGIDNLSDISEVVNPMICEDYEARPDCDELVEKIYYMRSRVVRSSSAAPIEQPMDETLVPETINSSLLKSPSCSMVKEGSQTSFQLQHPADDDRILMSVFDNTSRNSQPSENVSMILSRQSYQPSHDEVP